ncbi:MAG: lipoprotein 17-related variable surface protein [Mycoplasma sp.]|nr:lipoprotein 17-related variable surface protein [Mycoplasma sp.]
MKRKIALIFGTLAVAGTVATVASCGSGWGSGDEGTTNGNAQQSSIIDKMNFDNIDKDSILKAIQITPSEIVVPSLFKKIESVKDLTINGVEHIDIEITNWTPSDENGSLSFHAKLSTEDNSSTKEVDITTSGWETELKKQKREKQKLLNNIPSQDILKLLNVPTEDSNLLPSLVPKPTTTILKNNEINNLNGVNLELFSWAPNDNAGTLVITVKASKINFLDKTYRIVTHWKNKSGYEQYKLTNLLPSKVSTLFSSSVPKEKLPSKVVLPQDLPSLSIDGVDNVLITPVTGTIRANDAIGTLAFDVTLHKDGLTDVTKTVTLGGFKSLTDVKQEKLDSISPTDVISKINLSPDSSTFVGNVPQPADLTAQTIGDLDGLSIAITNWNAATDTGIITFDATISKNGLTPKRISGITLGTASNHWRTTAEAIKIVDQPKLNNIDLTTILSKLGIVHDEHTLPSASVLDGHKTATIPAAETHTTSDITITVDSYNANPANGHLNINVTLFAPGLDPVVKTNLATGQWQTQTEHNQALLHKITKAQTKEAIMTLLTIDNSVPVTAIQKPNVSNLNQIGDANGVNIEITTWTPNANDGTITFSATITKGSETKTIDDIKIGTASNHWQTTAEATTLAEQAKLDSIVESDVKSLLPSITIVNSVKAPTIPPADLTAQTIAGLDGLNVAITNWNADDTTGIITFDATISKNGLTPKRISGITLGTASNHWRTTAETIKIIDGITEQNVIDFYTSLGLNLQPSARTYLEDLWLGNYAGVKNYPKQGITVKIEIIKLNLHPDTGKIDFGVRIWIDGYLSKIIDNISIGTDDNHWHTGFRVSIGHAKGLAENYFNLLSSSDDNYLQVRQLGSHKYDVPMSNFEPSESEKQAISASDFLQTLKNSHAYEIDTPETASQEAIFSHHGVNYLRIETFADDISGKAYFIFRRIGNEGTQFTEKMPRIVLKEIDGFRRLDRDQMLEEQRLKRVSDFKKQNDFLQNLNIKNQFAASFLGSSAENTDFYRRIHSSDIPSIALKNLIHDGYFGTAESPTKTHDFAYVSDDKNITYLATFSNFESHDELGTITADVHIVEPITGAQRDIIGFTIGRYNPFISVGSKITKYYVDSHASDDSINTDLSSKISLYFSKQLAYYNDLNDARNYLINTAPKDIHVSVESYGIELSDPAPSSGTIDSAKPANMRISFANVTPNIADGSLTFDVHISPLDGTSSFDRDLHNVRILIKTTQSFYLKNGVRVTDDTNRQLADLISGIDFTPISNNYALTLSGELSTFDHVLPGITITDDKNAAPEAPNNLNDLLWNEYRNAGRQIKAATFFVYKLTQDVPDQDSWPTGTVNPVAGTNSYKTTTTNEFGILMYANGAWRTVSKFSLRNIAQADVQAVQAITTAAG